MRYRTHDVLVTTSSLRYLPASQRKCWQDHFRIERFRQAANARIPMIGIRNNKISNVPDPPSGAIPKILSMKSIQILLCGGTSVTSAFKGVKLGFAIRLHSMM